MLACAEPRLQVVSEPLCKESSVLGIISRRHTALGSGWCLKNHFPDPLTLQPCLASYQLLMVQCLFHKKTRIQLLLKHLTGSWYHKALCKPIGKAWQHTSCKIGRSDSLQGEHISTAALAQPQVQSAWRLPVPCWLLESGQCSFPSCSHSFADKHKGKCPCAAQGAVGSECLFWAAADPAPGWLWAPWLRRRQGNWRASRRDLAYTGQGWRNC